MAMAMPPTQKIPAQMAFHCQCFAVRNRASTSGSSSKSTCAKVFGLSKMEKTRPGIPALTFRST